MKLTNKTTIVFLYILTLLSSLVSIYLYGWKGFAVLILLLSGIKFLLVTFQFMEMKKAHSFWKSMIFLYLGLYITIVSFVLLFF